MPSQEFEPGSIYVSVGEAQYLIVEPGESTVDQEKFNLKDMDKYDPWMIQLPDGSTLLFAMTDHLEKGASETPGARVAVEMTVQGLSPMIWHGRINDGMSEKLFGRIEIIHKA